MASLASSFGLHVSLTSGLSGVALNQNCLRLTHRLIGSIVVPFWDYLINL